MSDSESQVLIELEQEENKSLEAGIKTNLLRNELLFDTKKDDKILKLRELITADKQELANDKEFRQKLKQTCSIRRYEFKGGNFIKFLWAKYNKYEKKLEITFDYNNVATCYRNICISKENEYLSDYWFSDDKKTMYIDIFYLPGSSSEPAFSSFCFAKFCGL
jgi:hypothetical protein